jgi:AAA15 family ATPase/GTPase
MIEKVVIQNFKRFEREEFVFSEFDIIAGVNNSGKSTVLQALAIWQFVVTAFSGQIRSGNTGIQVVLPNFSALPVPEFNLLWRNRQDRAYPIENGKKKQTYILIEIEVFWKNPEGEVVSFGIQLRYQSPQSVYAIPKNGWAALTGC